MRQLTTTIDVLISRNECIQASNIFRAKSSHEVSIYASRCLVFTSTEQLFHIDEIHKRRLTVVCSSRLFEYPQQEMTREQQFLWQVKSITGRLLDSIISCFRMCAYFPFLNKFQGLTPFSFRRQLCDLSVVMQPAENFTYINLLHIRRGLCSCRDRNS